MATSTPAIVCVLQGSAQERAARTLAEMEPLFAAIAHGCAAGMHQTALDEVYWPRILREYNHYIGKKLGAFGTELSATSHFFEQLWHTPAAGLTEHDKAPVLNWAATSLRALGRLQEALQPMQAGLEMDIEQEDWKNAASSASSLSELQLTRGTVAVAVKTAEQSVELADKSGVDAYRMTFRTTLADAQHQAADLATARINFEQAETLQQEWQADYPQLYSLRGFLYCDLLLAAGEWREVQQRTESWLDWRTEGDTLLDLSLEDLTRGRASLQQAISLAITHLDNHQKNVGWISAASSTAIPLDTQF